MLQVHQVLAAGFIFNLDKKFSELVGCLSFGSDSNIVQMTVTLTLTAALSLACVSYTTSTGSAAVHSYKSPHHCPAEVIVELVNHKKTVASIMYFP